MFELLPLIGYLIAGIGVGMLAGLFPALPTFTGPFLLYQFHTGMSLEQMLIFWLAAYFGTQFFGSIATITTHIPGEESSLVYLDDLNDFTLREKNHLLYDTALGSFVAGILALAVAFVVANFSGLEQAYWLASAKAQLVIYAGLLLTFILSNRKRWLYIVTTILFGLSIAPKSNYALPDMWYQWQFLFEGYTFYLILLGVLIIPNIFNYNVKVDTTDHFNVDSGSNFNLWETIKASTIGIFAGLVPGPSASIGSIAAYRLLGNNKKKKIIAAEAANNSAVVMAVMPFLLLLIPLNMGAIIMSGIFDMQGITLLDEIWADSSIPGLSVLNAVLLLMVFATGIYYLLSTSFINFYVKIIRVIHGKIKIALITLVGFLIYLDLQSAEITVLHYFALLTFFTAVGFFLQRKGVSTIPLMFAILLGDKLIWSVLQLLQLYKIIG